MILLPRNCLLQIAAAAERVWPEEGCGLLVGRREQDGAVRITDVSEAANVAPREARRSRFEVDPAARFRLLRALRGSDGALVGHWHSHPKGAAVPSAYDASQAFEPDLVWLIISVADGRAGNISAWEVSEGAPTFRRLPLSVRP